MTWIKLEDTLPFNPKIAALSDRAYRLHTYALCYCGLNLTDGLIHTHMLNKLGIKDAKKHAQKLVEIGLWKVVENGYEINDYLKYQTSKMQAERDKETNRLRAEKARQAKSEALRNGVTNGVRSGGVTVTDTHTPTPTPTDNKKKKISVIKDDLDNSDFSTFWLMYPKKVGKLAAQKSFDKALKSATPQQIFEGVIRYQRSCGDDQKFIANPATWLNQGRWLDSNPQVKVEGIPSQSSNHFEAPAVGQYGVKVCSVCETQWPCAEMQKRGVK